MREKYEDRLRKLVGHRVRFVYAGGTQVLGRLEECRPAEGVVEIAVLRDAEVLSMGGDRLLSAAELPLPAGRLEKHEELH
jgi:hypothetical protein